MTDNIAIIEEAVRNAERLLMCALLDLARIEGWDETYIARLQSMASVLSIDLGRHQVYEDLKDRANG